MKIKLLLTIVLSCFFVLGAVFIWFVEPEFRDLKAILTLIFFSACLVVGIFGYRTYLLAAKILNQKKLEEDQESFAQSIKLKLNELQDEINIFESSDEVRELDQRIKACNKFSRAKKIKISASYVKYWNAFHTRKTKQYVQ